jgi:hypothetical protein
MAIVDSRKAPGTWRWKIINRINFPSRCFTAAVDSKLRKSVTYRLDWEMESKLRNAKTWNDLYSKIKNEGMIARRGT